jgi:hypothetical protein
MPYLMRLFNAGRLHISTAHDTPAAVGRWLAEYPIGELLEERPDGSGGTNCTTEVVYRDESGGEREATREEKDEVYAAQMSRLHDVWREEAPSCCRCGRKAHEREDAGPERITAKGPVCFACWTPEEREDLPSELRGL